MYWTLELASKLEDAPWPATKEELIDYAVRSGAPLEVLENLQEIEDEGDIYESIEDIWPDYPSKDDFFFIKIKAETKLVLDPKDYEQDVSLKGEFIRLVMASDASEEDKVKIIRTGLEALTGEEVTV